MSATHSQSVSHGNDNAAPAVPSAEIDASCRPVLLLFISAAMWLLAGSVLAMVATLKFHAPNLLTDCPFFTYGRVHPAHLNALLYGFALQAGLGVMLWIIAHLGRTRLTMTPAVLAGALMLNLGVFLGIAGILLGDSTGFEWLEMPRYASLMIFFGYLAIGLSALTTFHLRAERRLYTGHWFLIAAIFWFPWIYSTANFLLVRKPVRGALQAALDWWYMNNLSNVWLGLVGLGTIFYFIPKIAKRPLYSHGLGLFAFWGMVLFGSWGGIAPGTPLPAWMSALSTVAAVLTIVPVLSVAMNVQQTIFGERTQSSESSLLKFFCFGAAAFVVAGLVGPIVSLRRVSEVVNFTWFVPAQAQFVIYGFFAMTMFGAVYYIVPKVTQTSFCKPSFITLHFWLGALGILIYSLPLALGGIQQGMELKSKSFMDVMVGTLPYLRASTTGDLLMALGNLVFLMNLAVLLIKLGRKTTTDFLASDAKPAGVRA
jgi:cytochrome c oxidase cbb3-type subunit 1